jgi:type II secretion system protein H
MRHPRAFTLVELMVAILLAAIMATVVAVSLAGSQRAARAEDVLGRIATFDRLAREHARQFGRPNRLTFDLAQNTITRSAVDPNADESADTPATLTSPASSPRRPTKRPAKPRSPAPPTAFAPPTRSS